MFKMNVNGKFILKNDYRTFHMDVVTTLTLHAGIEL